MSLPKPNIIFVDGVAPGNHGGNRPARPTHITDHHVVGNSAAAIAEARKPDREMSFTFTIDSDGAIYQMLDVMTVPYTDGNLVSNVRAITIEHAGGLPNVPYTELMYQSSIRLHAWLREQYDIPEQNILRHREVIDRTRYPGGTACPGGLDVERIRRESTQLILGDDMSKQALTKEEVIEEHRAYFFSDPGANYDWRHVGGPLDILIHDFRDSGFRKDVEARYNAYDNLTSQVSTLKGQVDDLAKNPTQEAFNKLRLDMAACEQNAKSVNDKLAQYQQNPPAPGDSGANWFVKLLASIIKKK